MEWTGERNEIFKGLDALYIPYNEGWDCHGRACLLYTSPSPRDTR